MIRKLDSEEKNTTGFTSTNKRGNPNVTIISEFGIYEAIFGSELKEAKAFKKWVKEVIKKLRKQSGLEGFQFFQMLDREYQKETMSKLSQSLRKPKRINFIKDNTIANKAVSAKYGYNKMVKKNGMTPDMLVDRQPILDATVELMNTTNEFNLDISVSEKIYEKFLQQTFRAGHEKGMKPWNASNKWTNIQVFHYELFYRLKNVKGFK